jgi:hypothetical protein
MPNSHPSFKVYRMVRTGFNFLFTKSYYGLLAVASFSSLAEAEKWIAEIGKKKVEYTILETFIS